MNSFSYYLPFLLVVFLIGPKSAMTQNDDVFKVVVNHEEQYSVWPANKKPTRGWKNVGIRGNQAKCQDYIEEVWTDMRPLSIQKMNLSKGTEYSVVVNHEEQYSIWPKKSPLPKRSRLTRTSGTLTACMKYINEVWTDMRPLSLRKG